MIEEGLLLDGAPTVQEILTRWPRAAYVFMSLRTACVGCQMARFCTLDDVAANYRLDRDSLVEALRQEQGPTHIAKGVQI
jgi:hybrid cluster-associated redox disulfide protein